MTEIDLVTNVDLQLVDCRENALETVDLGASTGLLEFFASMNRLRELDPSGCTGLVTIDLQGNRFETSPSLDAHRDLRIVDLRDNPLTEPDDSGLASLRERLGEPEFANGSLVLGLALDPAHPE